MTVVKVITSNLEMEQIHLFCWLNLAFSLLTYELKPTKLMNHLETCRIIFPYLLYANRPYLLKHTCISISSYPVRLSSEWNFAVCNTNSVFCLKFCRRGKIIQKCGNTVAVLFPGCPQSEFLLAAHSCLILSSRQLEICFIFCLHPLTSRKSKHWK